MSCNYPVLSWMVDRGWLERSAQFLAYSGPRWQVALAAEQRDELAGEDDQADSAARAPGSFAVPAVNPLSAVSLRDFCAGPFARRARPHE
jgi:hypothetical protein